MLGQVRPKYPQSKPKSGSFLPRSYYFGNSGSGIGEKSAKIPLTGDQGLRLNQPRLFIGSTDRRAKNYRSSAIVSGSASWTIVYSPSSSTKPSCFKASSLKR